MHPNERFKALLEQAYQVKPKACALCGGVLQAGNGPVCQTCVARQAALDGLPTNEYRYCPECSQATGRPAYHHVVPESQVVKGGQGRGGKILRNELECLTFLGVVGVIGLGVVGGIAYLFQLMF